MDYRKLISFGKSSYVVSLPKTWVTQNKLKKGDLIYFEENNQSLVLNHQNTIKKSENKEIIIPVNGKSVRRLQREIISAYIKDYKSIVLTGEEVKDKAKEIQSTIQNLMALEVMEQTSKRIVAKDFLDMNNISIFNLIKKMDIIVRAMIEDCENMFKEDNYENISHRDNDVNRLSFLVFRVVEFGLDNPSFMFKKEGLESRNLLNLWWFTFNLEILGDEVKRIARYMRETSLPEKEQQKFIGLLADAKKGYLSIMTGFHTQNEEPAHSVLESKDDFIKKCDQFSKDNKKIENVSLLVEKLKSMTTGMHNLGRVVYQYGFTKK
ncbi:phosphate uptake regulator PhoU [Candidatus Woesearchaeota archaeon]|nr:phosphate uptake regulator PhoU [Candidatus Woesearchaeota archaeon]